MPSKEDRALDHFKKGDYKSAERLFRDLYNESTTSAIKNNRKHNLANCLAAQNKDAEALDLMSIVSDTSPSDMMKIYTQALCFAGIGDFDSAVESIGRLPMTDLLIGHEEFDRLMESFLDLIAFCMNSTRLWMSHHKNCKIIESVLGKIEGVMKEKQVRWDPYIWEKNLAHIMFIMDNRYDTCARLYNDLVLASQRDSTMSIEAVAPTSNNVDPTILRNLCVSYILIGRNREAEQLIKEIELEVSEEQSEEADFSSTLYTSGTGSSMLASSSLLGREMVEQRNPLTHINLAVGTLYCVKNNYEFGMMRIIDSLEPVERKLTTFSWNQAKRCILSLLDRHCRQLIWAQDDLLDRVVQFLIRCETSGILLAANESASRSADQGRNSVTYEARYLRAILLNVIHD